MKAALLAEYHRPLELVERPEPEPAGPRDVVVRVGGAGVCATDLHAIDGLMEPAGVRPGVVLGHGPLHELERVVVLGEQRRLHAAALFDFAGR